MIVIGSQALKIGMANIIPSPDLGRTPVDLDLIGSHVDVGARLFINVAKLDLVKMTPEKLLAKAPDGRMVEIEQVRPGTSSVLYFQWAETMTKLPTAEFYGVEMQVASLAMLYSLKKSHRHSPRAFEKHVKDYNWLREWHRGVDVFEKITALRYKETVERERLRTPSLQKTTKDFFDDKVSNRTFIHDQIHEVMAFGDRPMFEKIKIDPNKVACSKDKFNALPYMDRIKCVQEEAYVIALERAMIPMLFEGEKIANPKEAYKWAVMRICTTLCSGWFREFALENYSDLISHYDSHYVNKFLYAVEDGLIKRIEK